MTRILHLLLPLVLVISSCGSGTVAPTTTAAPSTTSAPDPTTTQVDMPGDAPVVDWSDPAKGVETGGFSVAACEGGAPMLCVERDGETVGVVEAATYPISSFDDLDPAADSDANLAAFAAGFGEAMVEDRAIGCGADYRVELHEVQPAVIANTPGISFGFTGHMGDGRPSELNLQYATVVGEDIVSIVAAAYDEGGCPGKDELVSFDSTTLAEFRPHLESLLTESPLPAFGQPSALPDGSWFAWARSTGDGALTVDPAEFLSGEEAEQAAREDGVIAEGEDLPNDFYIRNPEDAVVAVPLDPAAALSVLGFDSQGQVTPTTVDFARLAAIIAGEDLAGVYGAVPGELPVQLEVRDGRLVEVRQVYIP